MQSNCEFAMNNGTPVELTPPVEGFAMFSIDMREYRENGEIKFPKLARRVTPQWMWEVTPPKAGHPAGAEAYHPIGGEETRKANLAKYISNGYAFDPQSRDNPNGGIIDDDDDTDE